MSAGLPQWLQGQETISPTGVLRLSRLSRLFGCGVAEVAGVARGLMSVLNFGNRLMGAPPRLLCAGRRRFPLPPGFGESIRDFLGCSQGAALSLCPGSH